MTGWTYSSALKAVIVTENGKLLDPMSGALRQAQRLSKDRSHEIGHNFGLGDGI